MMIKTFFTALTVFLLLAGPSSAGPGAASVPEVSSGDNPARVAIFYQAGLSMELNAIAIKSFLEMSDVFMKLGRFYPINWQTTQEAVSQADDTADLAGIAGELGADIYCVIYLERAGDMYTVMLRTFVITDRYRSLDRQIVLRSRIINNIPLKLAREVAWLHSGLGLNASVMGRDGSDTIINAGQWHGLTVGSYSSNRGKIRVIKTSRYSSVISTDADLGNNGDMVIETFPEWEDAVSSIEMHIDRSTIFSSSPTVEELKGDDPGKRFAKAFCIVNNGASLILPGYGSYLACGYLGIKKKVSIANAVLTPMIVFTQLTLTEMMTGFTTNFAPWIQDSDKTDAVQNLQIFCWSTLLTTYAASFLDQLAYQCELTRKLPPFFEHRNQAAAFLSLLVPGGGLYYKGHRLAGWTFYFTEMALAGFGAYYTGTDKHEYYSYAFGALALVKVIDIICAYLVEPTFSVYRLERERQAGRMTFSMNVVPDHMGKSMFAVSCGMQF